jgi:hypothetical protein
LKDYLLGILNHQKSKIEKLYSNIPMHGRITSPLEIPARERLNGLTNKIEFLTADIIKSPKIFPVFLRAYVLIKEEIDSIEAIQVTTLNRWNDIDRKINILVDKMTTEIAFPISPPVVSCSSQRYYYTRPEDYIIFIPLTEGNLLLHFPDLYHELGHSLLSFSGDTRLESYHKCYLQCVLKAKNYVTSETQLEERNRGPNSLKIYFSNWNESWPRWMMEIFCDLFSVAVIGPAFVWSHLHLCVSTGEDPYDVSLFHETTHPPDATRMNVMLSMLETLNFKDDLTSIKEKWNNYLCVRNSIPSPEYKRCFPESLLNEITTYSYEGVKSLNCHIAHPSMEGYYRNLLNKAWRKFWEAPVGYAEWEKMAVKKLIANTN